MREIKCERREQDGQEFDVFSTEICDCNVLIAAAGSTGVFPGAEKWDIKTYLRIEDGCCTNMRVNVGVDHVGRVNFVEIELQGHTELVTMIEALTFMRQALLDALDAKEHNYG